MTRPSDLRFCRWSAARDIRGCREIAGSWASAATRGMRSRSIVPVARRQTATPSRPRALRDGHLSDRGAVSETVLAGQFRCLLDPACQELLVEGLVLVDVDVARVLVAAVAV